MSKKLIEIASEIVQTQASLSQMSAADIASSLRQVFSTLLAMRKAESTGADILISELAVEAVQVAPEREKPLLAPEDSIQNDKVICLECGAEMKQLTQKHLVAHCMSQKEYKKKYGFAMRTPLAAKSLTKARSRAAKKRGLPEKLKLYLEAGRQAKSQAKTAPAPEASGPHAERAQKVKRRFSPKKMG